MATVVRKTLAEMAVFAAAYNALRLQIGAGAAFHMDQSEQTISAAVPTDLPTSLVLVNQITSIYTFHMADTLAHKVVGVALASTGNAVDLATAIAAANDIKAKMNTHIASTTFHYSADATNSIAAANATDLASLITLLTELRTDFAAHMASGPASPAMRVVNA